MTAFTLLCKKLCKRTKEYYGINCVTSFFCGFLILEDRVDGCPETSTTNYQSTLRKIP